MTRPDGAVGAIELRDVGKTYAPGTPRAVRALRNVSLEIHDNEFFTLLGPSGCASAVPKVRVNGRSEDVIFFDGVFFESSLKSIFFAS